MTELHLSETHWLAIDAYWTAEDGFDGEYFIAHPNSCPKNEGGEYDCMVGTEEANMSIVEMFPAKDGWEPFEQGATAFHMELEGISSPNWIGLEWTSRLIRGPKPDDTHEHAYMGKPSMCVCGQPAPCTSPRFHVGCVHDV